MRSVTGLLREIDKLISSTGQEGRYLITVINEEGALPEVMVKDIWRILPQKMIINEVFAYRCPNCGTETTWTPTMRTPKYCYECRHMLEIDYQFVETKSVIIDIRGSLFKRHENGGK